MLDADVAVVLGLVGESAKLNLNWLGNCTQAMDSQLVNVNVQGEEF